MVTIDSKKTISFSYDQNMLLSDKHDTNILCWFLTHIILTSLMSLWQIHDKHTMVDMFSSKWTSHQISYLRLCIQLDIAPMRNPF